MDLTLPPLPYAPDALEPWLSAESFDFHHGRHHQTYVTNLNRLIQGTEFHDRPLEQIVRESRGPIFNNAAQIWNHTFYWNSLSPQGGGSPEGPLLRAIEREFGSIAGFREAFVRKATANFGAGWTWLVRRRAGGVAIGADSPAGRERRAGIFPALMSWYQSSWCSFAHASDTQPVRIAR